jgi:hypothetical protein
MRRTEHHNRAAIKFGPLIALVVVALAVALYFTRSESRVEHRLSADIVGFEVRRESAPARIPPILESLATTVAFANAGSEDATISKARFFVSIEEDLSVPRSWSTTLHRDAMLVDAKIAPGGSLTHTFVIPWTGREETRYFPDGARIHLGFSISAKFGNGEILTRTERFGHFVQQGGLIASSDDQALLLNLPEE